ncbi:hypothetical protein Tco_0908068 [Tanacetum coccineum]|uniref:Uncharacterized protein n=1 Tax=Tanacetum coccineum TaxID=301880 RepID=A0ABQ5CPC2_9ASTR
MDQVESVKTSKALKEIFLEFKDVSHDFIPDERCVWIDLVGLPLASWALEVYKKLGGRGEAACLRIVYSYTDDNEDVTQVIAPEKDSIICASIYTPGTAFTAVYIAGIFADVDKLLIHFGPTWVKDDDDSMVQSLIEDTKDVRFHKIGTGLEKLSSWTYAMKNLWGCRIVTRYIHEACKEAVMSISASKTYSFEGIDEVVLDMLGTLGFGWNSLLWTSGERQDLQGVKRDIFEFKYVLTICILDERGVLDRPGGSALASWASRDFCRTVAVTVVSIAGIFANVDKGGGRSTRGDGNDGSGSGSGVNNGSGGGVKDGSGSGVNDGRGSGEWRGGRAGGRVGGRAGGRGKMGGGRAGRGSGRGSRGGVFPSSSSYDEQAFRECMEEQALAQAKIDAEQEKMDKERREEQEWEEKNDYFKTSDDDLAPEQGKSLGVDKGKAKASVEDGHAPKKNRGRPPSSVDGIRIYHKNRGRSERIANIKLNKPFQFEKFGTSSTPNKAFNVEE